VLSTDSAGHHLFDILRNQIRFEIDGVAGLKRIEIGHLYSMRNDGNGALSASSFATVKLMPSIENRALVNGVFLDLHKAFRCAATILRVRDRSSSMSLLRHPRDP